MLAWMQPWMLVALVALVALIGGLRLVLSCYQKVGPNEVLIISGRPGRYLDAESGAEVQRNFRIYHGGGSFVMPIREKADRLSVELMTLELLTPEFFTKFGVPIVVNAIAQIKVRSDDPIATATAAEMFLSKTTKQMNEIAHQMMQGHLRAVISTLPFEEIHANPEAFAQTVHRLTAADLANMGIQVVSFTIRQVRDPSGYLKAIGRPQLAEVEKNAVLGEATARRDAQAGRAEAEQEATLRSARAQEAAELAQLTAEVHIAAASKERDLHAHTNKQELAHARAESEMAYELEKVRIEQRLVTEQAGVRQAERRGQLEVEELEIQRRELELRHTIEKPAEAERTRILLLAEAEQARRESEARADAAAIRARGEAEAEAIRARALAEAEGLRAHYLAEAEGMKQKAIAWQSYGTAALGELFINKLPEVVAAVSEPLSRIDKITLVSTGADGSSGVDRITRGVVDVLAQVPQVCEALTGVGVGELLAGLPGLTPAAALPPEDSAVADDGAPGADRDPLG